MFFKIENFGKGSLNVLTERSGRLENEKKMYEDKIRTKEEQKAKEKQEKK